MKKLRKIVSFVLSMALFASLTACGAAKESVSDKKNVPDVVNIGVQTLITPELVARADQVFEENMGTKVNLVQFDSGADVNKAFASGSIDIGMLGSSPASLGIANDLGYEVIWYYDVIGTAESLVAKNDSGIASVKDLVGKKVATPFASTAHYSLLNALALEGVNPADVELLDMQPDDILAAWGRGDIDAAYVWNPVLGKISSDAVVLTDSQQLADQGIVTADVGAVRKEFAEQYPDVVVGYIKALLYGLDEFNNNKEESLKKIASAAEITEEEAAQQVETFIYPSGEDLIGTDYLGTKEQVGKLAEILKATADFNVDQGTIESAPELSAFEKSVTGEFVEKALSE